MATPFEGKTALVTGSTSGMGEAAAMKLASLGANVAVTGSRGAEDAKESIGKITAAAAGGAKVEYFQADLSNPFEACPVLVASINEKLGDIDILVNNAGIQHVSRVETFPVDKWQFLMNVHLNASFMLMQLCLPAMQKKNEGRIINISSVHGLVSSVEKSAYCAAKHGLNGLTKSAALENAESGIAINAICPGWVHTPLVQKQIDRIADQDKCDDDTAKKKLLSAKEPSKNFTTVDDIADMIVFLCGKAGGNMKGSLIQMDGGWTAV
jgi:3-hydroxybutyrate dehydrogenase